MEIRDGWARKGDMHLHYLESRSADESSGLPLLVVPGTFGMAEDYRDEMEALRPRSCVAVSLRGRGRSDAPETGYALDDHVADLSVLVAAIGLPRFALMAYSMAVPWALAWALAEPNRVAGMILGDYPARYRALAPTWVERALAAMGDRALPVVAQGLQRESAEVLFWDRLAELACPVWVLRGGQPGTMVTDEVADRYRQHLPTVEIVTVEKNGHELWKPDFDGYAGAIRGILETLDAVPG